METTETLLRLPQVVARTGLSRSTIYALIKSGEFPSAISIGRRSRAWTESSVQRWIIAKIAATAQTDKAQAKTPRRSNATAATTA